MAEEEKEETKVEAPPAKSSKKLFMIIGGVVAVIAIGGGAFFFLGNSKKVEKNKEELSADAASNEPGLLSQTAVDGEEPLEEGEEPLGAIYPLETFVVNLTGGKYVRLQVQLEFVTRDVPKRFLGRNVVVRDAIIDALNKKTADTILADGGKDAVKKEIKDIVNEALGKEEIKHVYFTQFIVQ